MRWTDNQRGESGRFVDYFLYNSKSETGTIDIVSSLRSNELMNKNYFIGNLEELNKLANNIIENPKINQSKNKNQTKNNPNDLTNLFSKSTKVRKVKDKNIDLNEIGCDIDY